MCCGYQIFAPMLVFNVVNHSGRLEEGTIAGFFHFSLFFNYLIILL